MARELPRKTPEDFLRECQAEEAAVREGRLKIFLGYASGVGKSFRMLDEARRRRERGQDVVVGAVQPQVPPEVEALLTKLEVIPLKQIDHGMAIDVDALIKRHPAVCFIDGLAYDNPPGSRNPTRWQDVQDLLPARRSEEHTSELQSRFDLVCRLLLEKKKRTVTICPIFLFNRTSDTLVTLWNT